MRDFGGQYLFNRSDSSVEFLHAAIKFAIFFAAFEIFELRSRKQMLDPISTFQAPRWKTAESRRNPKILVWGENLGPNVHEDPLKPILNPFLVP